TGIRERIIGRPNQAFRIPVGGRLVEAELGHRLRVRANSKPKTPGREGSASPYLASSSPFTAELGTNPPGSMGRPPRPSTMKLLMFPLSRTPQSGRNCDSALNRFSGNATRLPLRSTSGAETLTVPGRPNGAEASMVLLDWKK